jgi:hypothetical protein
MTLLDRATPERLSALSDGVFAVLITVLVLELRPPELPTFKALLLLWPTWLSYAVSYLFIAIVWTNHHYLMALCDRGDPSTIVVQFRTSLLHIAASALHRLDGREQISFGAGCFLCVGVLSGKCDVHMFDLGAY